MIASYHADVTDDIVKPQMVIFVEGVKISRAKIKSLATQKQAGANQFCPVSVAAHTWLSLDYLTVDRCFIPSTFTNQQMHLAI